MLRVGRSRRDQRRLDFAKNCASRSAHCCLPGLIRDQILADFDSCIHQPARLAMHGNGGIGLVADRIELLSPTTRSASPRSTLSSTGGKRVSR